MSLDVLASLKWPADGWSWWLQITCKQRISWSGTYRHPWNLSYPSAHSQPEGRSEVPNLLCRSTFGLGIDRKSTRLNSSHTVISYAVFCLKKKKQHTTARAL